MPVEVRDEGTLVYGYLDTSSPDRAHATDTVLIQAAVPYAAEARPYRFGALNACEIAGEHPVRVLPRPSRVAVDSGFLLGLLLAGGGELEQDGRRCRLGPGDVVLYTGRRPFRLDLERAYDWFMIDVDPGADLVMERTRAVAANEEVGRSPTARILAAMLGEVAQRARDLGPLSRAELGDHVTGLLHTLARESGPTQPCAGITTDTVLDRVLAYVDRHLAEDLPPARIAAAHHVSVRTLHALFEREGTTVGGYVRRRRLQRIRRDLADPALAHLTAYAVAARWGIQGPSHLSKAFKAEFGVSPRAVRAEAAPAEPG